MLRALLCLLNMHDWVNESPKLSDLVYKNGWLTEYQRVDSRHCSECGAYRESNRRTYVTFLNFGKKFDDQTIEDIENMRGVFAWNNLFWRHCVDNLGHILRNDDPFWHIRYKQRLLKKDEEWYAQHTIINN